MKLQLLKKNNVFHVLKSPNTFWVPAAKTFIQKKKKKQCYGSNP